MLGKIYTTKIYFAAQRMVYVEQIRKLQVCFVKEEILCSLYTFFKVQAISYNNSYGKRKGSCLCKKCQNIHLLINCAKNYPKSDRMILHSPATEFVKKILFILITVEKKHFRQSIQEWTK